MATLIYMSFQVVSHLKPGQTGGGREAAIALAAAGLTGN